MGEIYFVLNCQGCATCTSEVACKSKNDDEEENGCQKIDSIMVTETG